MKRMIVAVSMLLLLIIGCFYGYQKLDLLSQEIGNHIAEADARLGISEHDTAYADLLEAYQLWRSKQALLGSLVRHNELEDIEKLFLRAMQSMHDGEWSAYRLYARELQGTIAHLPEMERPSIQNIF